MYVCLCSAVTTDQIIQCVRSGCKDLDAVTKQLGAGLNCGSCIYMISDLIAKTESQDCSRAVDSDRFEPDDI
ncbi:MAG: bacterioferritin [Gammaproteobacteria bacterium]|nr:bacterioferritin [Gammaproteobacteria bacterium]MYF01963.1 bacterioferritin [Gammaproteobacteria bacterium]